MRERLVTLTDGIVANHKVLYRERIFIELMTSDRKLKASIEGWK